MEKVDMGPVVTAAIINDLLWALRSWYLMS